MKLLIENEMSLKFGRKVIVLDARFKEILTIPPSKKNKCSNGRPTGKFCVIHRSHVKGVWYEPIYRGK